MKPDDPMKVTCTATNRQGKRCGKAPIPGGRVCRMHGGAAPQVQLAAAERLKALEIPALVRLGELIEQREFPSVAIAAVKDALDRIQGKAIENINVRDVTNTLSDDELRAKAAALGVKLK